MDGHKLVKQTLDQIPQPNPNAKRITGLVKEGGRITGYQLSDNSIVEKQQAVNMARQGQIAASPTGEIRNTSNPSPTAAKTTILAICLPYPQNLRFFHAPLCKGGVFLPLGRVKIPMGAICNIFDFGCDRIHLQEVMR